MAPNVLAGLLDEEAQLLAARQTACTVVFVIPILGWPFIYLEAIFVFVAQLELLRVRASKIYCSSVVGLPIIDSGTLNGWMRGSAFTRIDLVKITVFIQRHS